MSANRCVLVLGGGRPEEWGGDEDSISCGTGQWEGEGPLGGSEDGDGNDDGKDDGDGGNEDENDDNDINDESDAKLNGDNDDSDEDDHDGGEQNDNDEETGNENIDDDVEVDDTVIDEDNGASNDDDEEGVGEGDNDDDNDEDDEDDADEDGASLVRFDGPGAATVSVWERCLRCLCPRRCRCMVAWSRKKIRQSSQRKSPAEGMEELLLGEVDDGRGVWTDESGSDMECCKT
jgi:hypothetical protein